MKPLSEMNHYEVLDIPRDAGLEAIERARAAARSTYASDSLALYSVFGEAESELIRERIEVAYRVLADPEARRDYEGTLDPASPTPGFASELEQETPLPPAELDAEIEGLDDPDDEALLSEFGGARLRRARLRRGLTLEKIAEITKISPAYLRYLEEDYQAGLPAEVYVRGFVSAYARCVGLEPKAVSASYMQRLLAASAEDGTPRGRRPR